MNFDFPVVNSTSELEDCRNGWTFDQTFHCWCLEDILYTQKATTPKFQRMSIFVPAAYLNAEGTVDPNGRCGEYTSLSAPVIFENNSAGYMQMPHTWLGGPRDEAGKYLAAGMVYVTCGCRGRESRNADGVLCGKAPWTLIDLKTGIRFLRHNAAVLPGDFSHIVSVGWSAGGAMSALLGVTGDNPLYDPYLEQNGAFLSESDAVFASQVYCPIVDLEHADLAYEWQFNRDEENEDSPAGPAGKMTSFMKALSQKLSERYIRYFNGLGLHASDGTPLTLGPDGRSGTAYSALMNLLNDSASDFLHRLDCGTLGVPYTVSDYLAGHYTVQKPAPAPKADRTELLRGHAGPGVALNTNCDSPASPSAPPSLGDLVSRPPRGVPYHGFQPPMIEAPGDEKSDWLYWDGKRAVLADLDSYLLHHRRRMKPCTSFDTLGMDSGENQEFGTSARDYMHFCTDIAASIAELKDSFPAEYNKYYISYAACIGDTEQERRKFLINPLNFIGTSQPDSGTKHYRIRVGAQDADTAFIISLTLAAKLQNATLAKTPCGQYVHGVKQELTDKQKKRLLSSTSIHEVHTLLKTAFSYAVEWDLIHKIPLPREAPKANSEERTIWDEKTMLAALQTIENPALHLAVHLSMILSLREGEILGLQPSDLDFDAADGRGTILVNKTMQRANKDALEKLDPNQVYHTFPDRREGSKSSLILKKPKTKKSNRVLYMTKPLKEELLAWLEKLKQDEQNAPEKYRNCGQLFRLPDGLPIAPELLTKWYRQWRSAHPEFEQIVFHGLRHSSATYQLLQSDGDFKSVQGNTGHATAAVLMDTYAHTQDKPRLELAEKIEANFYSQDLTPAAPQQPPENKQPEATKITGKEILEAIRLMDAEERRELTRALFA